VERPKLEVADVFRRYGEAYRQQYGASLSVAQRRVMTAIEVCRTEALGGHLERCDQCGYERNAYNSCRDRHCPKCQCLVRAQWIQDRQSELLNVPYFHVVFTVPEQIAAIAYQNKEVVYGILFQATAETLKTIAADPQHLGAEIGFFAVLHTWGQNLQVHPHLHCVVPGGGLSPDGQRWISCRPDFFLPVRVLGHLFRRLFLESLRKAFDSGKLHFFAALESFRQPEVFADLVARMKACEWVVYAKRPFAGPQQVLDYVGRYTHRVAISNKYRKRSGPLPVEGLSGRRQDQNDGLVRRRVHSSFLAARITEWIPTDPLLRFAGQSLPQRKTSAVPAPARHVTPIRANQPIAGGERPPGPLRRTHRQLAAPMSAVPARPYARSRDLAPAAVQFCTAHRLIMIRFLLLTRDRWAWQRQCDAGVLPVRGVLG
jgi:hypothetical protein